MVSDCDGDTGNNGDNGVRDSGNGVRDSRIWEWGIPGCPAAADLHLLPQQPAQNEQRPGQEDGTAPELGRKFQPGIPAGNPSGNSSRSTGKPRRRIPGSGDVFLPDPAGRAAPTFQRIPRDTEDVPEFREVQGMRSRSGNPWEFLPWDSGSRNTWNSGNPQEFLPWDSGSWNTWNSGNPQEFLPWDSGSWNTWNSGNPQEFLPWDSGSWNAWNSGNPQEFLPWDSGSWNTWNSGICSRNSWEFRFWDSRLQNTWIRSGNSCPGILNH
nr:uncharacterized protein LOC113460514 [Zonotrichia albicollis]